MLRIALHEVKPLILRRLGLLMWRHRQSKRVRKGLKRYIALLKHSPRWWFQSFSLLFLIICLSLITQNFVSVYLNHQHLKQLGNDQLYELDKAVAHLEQGDSADLIKAQKSIYDYIQCAKSRNPTNWLVARLGVDAERSQVCPYARALLSSLERGVIIPMAKQLEESLQGYMSNWQQQDFSTQIALYPLYEQRYHCYESLNGLHSSQALTCLAEFWYQSLDNHVLEESKITENDLIALLDYYFKRRQVPYIIKTDLMLQVQKQLTLIKVNDLTPLT